MPASKVAAARCRSLSGTMREEGSRQWQIFQLFPVVAAFSAATPADDDMASKYDSADKMPATVTSYTRKPDADFGSIHAFGRF